MIQKAKQCGKQSLDLAMGEAADSPSIDISVVVQ